MTFVRTLAFAVTIISVCNIAAASEKFVINGSTIIYDTYAATHKYEKEITWDDVDELESLLKFNTNITKIELNSGGGIIEAAVFMADLIIDFELDTNVNGTCESACTLIFLGGEKRTVERGSWLGFHQSYWDASYIQDFYEQNQNDSGWTTPFDFASWLYEDTQQEVLRNLEYFVERGVDARFAIKTMRATSNDMWYPRRKELEAAGVIFE